MRIALAIVIVLLVLLLVGPFLIPVRPLRGLVPAERLADADSRFIDVPLGSDSVRVHYKELGSGERNLLLLHGFGASEFSWREVMADLAQGARVVAFDRPAFGLTERPLRENWGTAADWDAHNPYSLQAQVDLTIGLLDQLGMERAVLVGNSAGGTVAMLTALQHPERVEALVLLDPAVYAGERGGGLRWLFQTAAGPASRPTPGAPDPHLGQELRPLRLARPGADHRRDLGRLFKAAAGGILGSRALGADPRRRPQRPAGTPRRIGIARARHHRRRRSHRADERRASAWRASCPQAELLVVPAVRPPAPRGVPGTGACRHRQFSRQSAMNDFGRPWMHQPAFNRQMCSRQPQSCNDRRKGILMSNSLIWGASGGIGRAIVQALAQQGLDRRRRQPPSRRPGRHHRLPL